MAALLRCMRRTTPEIVLGEQVAGLLTHRKASLWMLLTLLKDEPYEWFLARGDASALGACHHRDRLLLLGVRADRLATGWKEVVSAARLPRETVRGRVKERLLRMQRLSNVVRRFRRLGQTRRRR